MIGNFIIPLTHQHVKRIKDNVHSHISLTLDACLFVCDTCVAGGPWLEVEEGGGAEDEGES